MPLADDVRETLAFDERGLIPAIVQQHDTGEVLMFAWMDDEALERTLQTGRGVVLVALARGAVAQGRDLGQHHRRARGPLRLRRRRAARARRRRRRRRLPHRRAHLLLPRPRRRDRRVSVVPGREEFVRLAADHGSARRPRDPAVGLRQARRRRAELPARVGRARERWGRYSFVGFDPFLTLLGRDGEVTWEGEPPAEAATRPGARRARPGHRGLPGPAAARPAAARRRGRLPRLRRGPRGRGHPGHRARRPRAARRVLLFPRHVVALDHLRQVLTVVTNVVVGDTRRRRRARPRYDEAVAATDAVVERLATAAPPLPPVAPPRPGPPTPPRPTSSPASTRRWSSGSRSTSGPATPSRPSSASGSRSRRRPPPSTCTGCCGSSTRRRTCTCSTSATRRSSAPRPRRWCRSRAARGDLADRRHPPRGATPEEDRAHERSWSPTPRSGPSTSCSSTSPATTSAGCATSAASRSTR
jgi:hypothetical protein